MDHISYETALLWVFLLPLAGALINGLLGRTADRQLVGGIAVGTVVMSFALAVLCAVRVFVLRAHGPGADARIVSDVYSWISVGPLPIDVRFVLDPLSAVMTLVVTGIGALIHVFSLGYMSEEKSWARYFACLNLFTASMLLLVLASSLPVLFVGWEGVGVCSYLLIGFWHEEGAFADAAKKAFIVNRIGDFGVLVGMIVLASATGSFEMSAINAAAEGSLLSPFFSGPILLAGITVTKVTLGAMLLFFGCSGKSAQMPLYVWLPDAMAGPTPVSALIHAATMVTAGVYLCCRLSSVFLASHTTLLVIAVAGAITAIIGATSALVQNDLKKILAYSTVSQLGFMFAAIGVGAFTAGIFHVVTHAFFKACLFLGAGSIMHAVHAHGDADIRYLGGLGEKMPKTRITFLISVLAIAGVPLFSGFFSKDEILAGAARTGLYALQTDRPFAIVAWVVLVLLAIAAVLTGFYMFRTYAMIFRGSYRGAGHYAEAPHESESVLTTPLIVLAGGAVLIGLIGMPHWWHVPNLLGHLLEGTVHDIAYAHATNLPSFIALAVGISVAVAGLLAAYVMYPGDAEDPLPTSLPGALYRFLFDTWRMDGLYARIIVRPMHRLAELAVTFDRYVVDVLFVRLPSLIVVQLSKLAVFIQDGVVHTYALAMVIGLAGLVGFYAYPHIDLTAVVDGNDVKLSTPRGLGYKYRWDVNGDASDGHGWESELTADLNEIEAHYDARDYVGVELLVITEPHQLESTLHLGSHPRELTVADLGENAFLPPSSGPVPTYRPTAFVRDRRLHVRPNGAEVAINNRVAPSDGELVIAPNSSVRIGRNLILVLPVVRVVLEVETVLGQHVRKSFEIPLRQESTRQDIPVTQIQADEQEAP